MAKLHLYEALRDSENGLIGATNMHESIKFDDAFSLLDALNKKLITNLSFNDLEPIKDGYQVFIGGSLAFYLLESDV